MIDLELLNASPARIEHLRGRAECGSNTCTLPHARGSNICAVAGGSDRTDPSCSMPRIEHLRGRAECGSNTCTPLHARADRTLARSPGARIEQIRSARSRGSRPFGVAGRADRHPSGPRDPADRTLAGRADRTLTRSGGVRIEHLHPAPRPRGSNICRTRGSTPFRPDPRHGSTPFAGAGRADRHPSGPIHAVDRHPRRRRARGSRPFRSARSCGSNTCRTRGSNTCAVAGGSDRTDPVCSMSWIEHLRSRRRRGSRPFQFAPRRGSTPFAVAGAQIDTLRRRRIDTLRGLPNSADRHPFRPLDPMDRDPSRSSGRGSTTFTVAGRRESGRSSGGAAVSTGRPAALRLPPGSTAPEPRKTK